MSLERTAIAATDKHAQINETASATWSSNTANAKYYLADATDAFSNDSALVSGDTDTVDLLPAVSSNSFGQYVLPQLGAYLLNDFCKGWTLSDCMIWLGGAFMVLIVLYCIIKTLQRARLPSTRRLFTLSTPSAIQVATVVHSSPSTANLVMLGSDTVPSQTVSHPSAVSGPTLSHRPVRAPKGKNRTAAVRALQAPTAAIIRRVSKERRYVEACKKIMIAVVAQLVKKFQLRFAALEAGLRSTKKQCNERPEALEENFQAASKASIDAFKSNVFDKELCTIKDRIKSQQVRALSNSVPLRTCSDRRTISQKLSRSMNPASRVVPIKSRTQLRT